MKVNPGAARSEVTGVVDGVLQVKIAALPQKSKANRELISFLAGALGVKKSAVSIIKGESGRHKLVSVEGLTPQEIIKHLSR